METKVKKKWNWVSSMNGDKEKLTPSSLVSSNPVADGLRGSGLMEEAKVLEDSYHVFDHKANYAKEEEEIIESVVYHPPNISLSEFEEKCPPGGSNSVIFYTTSLRGIRKTFEDCGAVRFLLESFRVCYEERDVSMDMELREELWRIMGVGRVVPPRLFIKGRHIGGADEVVGLHEQGKLEKLLEGLPLNSPSNNSPCKACAGMRFLLCFNCNGSCKVFADGDKQHLRCPHCNENGLIKCPICLLAS